MRKITNVVAFKKAYQLAAVINLRRELEKQEAELKEYFKALLGDDLIAMIGTMKDGFIVSLTERARNSLDIDLLKEELGDSFIKYQYQVDYKVFDIKATK